MISLVWDFLKKAYVAIVCIFVLTLLGFAIYQFFFEDQKLAAGGLLATVVFSIKKSFFSYSILSDDFDKELILLITILGVLSVAVNSDFFDLEKQEQNVELTYQTYKPGNTRCSRYFQPDDNKRSLFNKNVNLLRQTCATQSTEDGKTLYLDMNKVIHLPVRVGAVDTMISTFDKKSGPLTCTELAQQMDKLCPNFLRF